jgi:hypothetical protein
MVSDQTASYTIAEMRGQEKSRLEVAQDGDVDEATKESPMEPVVERLGAKSRAAPIPRTCVGEETCVTIGPARRNVRRAGSVVLPP